jgi:hypothetical protein
VTKNAAAYYHWPPVWVGGGPPISRIDIGPSMRGEEVYRASLAVGIRGKVLREGMFIFDFSDWVPGCFPPDSSQLGFDGAAAVILQRAAVLNAHLVCLHTALSRGQNFVLPKMVVSPLDLISLRSLDDTELSVGESAAAVLAAARYGPTHARFRVIVIEINTVHESFQLLDTILQHETPYALLIADLYARACKAYEDHNYGLCLVTAWAIIEKLLQQIWTRYVEANRQREIDGAEEIFINKDRRKRLTEGRDFTASMISEILSLMDYLPFELYRELSTVRQARNNWIHSLEPVSRGDAERSVRVTEQMLKLVDGINLEVPLYAQIHY